MSHREQEWQFTTADLGAVREWLSGGASRGDMHVEARPAIQNVDTYYDTPDWIIHRAGYSLRIRETSSATQSSDDRAAAIEITLKSLTDSRGGFADRREISEPLSSADVDTVASAHGDICGRVRALAGPRPLTRLFQARTQRERFVLTPGNGGRELAQVALDQTCIDGAKAGAASDAPAKQLNRVETECLDGPLERLEGWVAEMRAAGHLEPANTSKFQLGLSTAGLVPATSARLGPTEIARSMELTEVAFAIFRRYLQALIEHEPGTRLGEQPEELHDMRVAARRLDSAIRLFRNYVPQWVTRSRTALHRLVRALGAVRDLDVRLARLRTFAADLPQDQRAAVEPLCARLEHDRRRARASMLRTLDSVRVQHLLTVWIQNLRKTRRPARRGPAPPPIELAAYQMIRRRYKKLRKRTDLLTPESTPEEYHAIRSRVKRLRYAAADFEPIYGKDAGRFARAVGRFQDALGEFQDVQVTKKWFGDIASGRSSQIPGESLFVMGRLAERDSDIEKKFRARFSKVYRRVKGRRWKALRKCMQALADEVADESADESAGESNVQEPSAPTVGPESASQPPIRGDS